MNDLDLGLGAVAAPCCVLLMVAPSCSLSFAIRVENSKNGSLSVSVWPLECAQCPSGQSVIKPKSNEATSRMCYILRIRPKVMASPDS